jgi:hypothetical protein
MQARNASLEEVRALRDAMLNSEPANRVVVGLLVDRLLKRFGDGGS